MLYTPLHAFGGVVVFDFLWWVVPVGAVWVAPVPRFVVVALACVLDARPLYKVSKEVVCLLPHWVELVYVNTLPEVSALTVGSEDPKEAEVAVPLGAMEEPSRFTRGQCVFAHQGVDFALVNKNLKPWDADVHHPRAVESQWK